jgi:uncharacterized delta-60 repeat protein
VAVGSAFIGNLEFAVARCHADGSLDTSFGTGGKAVTPMSAGADSLYAVAIQADGKILLVGGAAASGGIDDFALARYTTAGALDPTFGTGGRVTTPIGTSADSGRSVALQTDGRIVVAGLAYIGGSSDFALARYGVAQGDTRVGANRAVTRGNNLYNVSAAGQTQKSSVRHGGGSRNVFVGIENEGPLTDSFTVRGTRGNSRFKVKYLRGAANVTGAVTRGTLGTGPLAPGANLLLKVRITAVTPVAGKTRNVSVTSTSASDPAALDRVSIKAKSK